MPEGRRRSSTTAERLGRMLAIVPYLVKHEGTTIEQAVALFGVDPEQLRRDLELLFMSGVPPYGPGDLIDVLVDDDGSITISMADHFARPLRLTRQEALAVSLRATELLATPGLPDAPALRSALDKIRATLGPDTVDAEGIDATAGPAPPASLETVRAAAADRCRIRIEYLAASTSELSTRTIDPEAVFASLGRWYVAAWDLEADGERLFRVDRIRQAELMDERFEPRGLRGAGRPMYTPSAGDVAVRLRLRAEARWVAEYYETTDLVELDDGGVEITLPSRRLDWVARLLLRLGDAAIILDPPELREQLRDAANATLARYRA